MSVPGWWMYETKLPTGEYVRSAQPMQDDLVQANCIPVGWAFNPQSVVTFLKTGEVMDEQ